MCVWDDSTFSFQTRDIFSLIYPNVLVKNTVFSPEWECLKWKWETWWIHLIFTNLASGLNRHPFETYAHQNYGSFPQVFGGQKALTKTAKVGSLNDVPLSFRCEKKRQTFFFFSWVPSQFWPGTVTQPFLDHQWNEQFKNLTIFLLSKGLPSQKLTWHLQGGRAPKGNSSSNPSVSGAMLVLGRVMN